METSGFDKLFSKSVPHIFERIFLNLDYDSLMASRKVSKVWKELLTSEPYRRRAMEMLREENSCERRLWESSRNGDAWEVGNLLSLGVDPNSEYRSARNTWYPLIDAIGNDHIEVVKLLLNAGANPDRFNGGNTPLYWATWYEIEDAVQVLLNAGAKVDLADTVEYTRRYTPLQCALQENWKMYSKKIIILLIDAGADVNKTNHWGETPLLQATKWQNILPSPLKAANCRDVVKVLLDHGADPNRADDTGKTPLSYASRNGHVDVMKVLVEAGGGERKLWESSRNGDAREVSNLLSLGVDPNSEYTTTHGWRHPLGDAIENGHTEVVKLLLNAGANPDKDNYGHMDVAKLLTEAGAK